MSSKWGFSEWGKSPWGLAVSGISEPQIINRFPLPNSIDVAENTPIAVWFFDADFNLDTSTTLIVINGVTAYSGVSGFSPEYTGTVNVTAGSLVIQLFKLGGFNYEETVTITASISDTTALSTTDTWSWKVKANPLCYGGNAPLPIELIIQQPIELFIGLEAARQALFDSVIKTNVAVNQRGNKAARVIYQLAFSTELSTVLNPYNLKNKDALKTTVCERENILKIDQRISTVKEPIKLGIQELYNKRVLPQEYVTGFMDYLDSALPSYRVSLVANMVLLARAYETRS